MAGTGQRRPEHGRQRIAGAARRHVQRRDVDGGIGRTDGLERRNRHGHLSDIAVRKVAVPVVQPDRDGVAGEGRPDNDVEIVIAVDVREPDRDGIQRRFEGDVVRGLSGD